MANETIGGIKRLGEQVGGDDRWDVNITGGNVDNVTIDNATITDSTIALSTPLAPSSGGTGVANSSTITVEGNLTHAGAFTQTFTAVQGENFITTGDLAYNTAAGTLAVGDYIRVADDALNGTLALTDPVYQVTKITGTTKVYLDRPWTNASGSWTDAGDGAQVIPAATGLAATWGIKFTGVAQSNFKAGVFNYKVPRFKVEPQNCGTSTVTYTTAASDGSGVYGQIAELEWFAQGNLGLKYRVDTPPVTLHTQAASGSTYETIHIKYKTAGSNDSVTGTTPGSHAEIVLAFVVNSDSGDKIIATLTEWAAANLGYSVAW